MWNCNLTREVQPPELDFQTVEDLGFEIITGDHESHQLWKERKSASGELAAESCGTSCSTC